jgi:hypothetical protein
MIPAGLQLSAEIANSVTAPVVVIRPILPRIPAANSPPTPIATGGIHVPVTADHVGATASARSVPDEEEPSLFRLIPTTVEKVSSRTRSSIRSLLDLLRSSPAT